MHSEKKKLKPHAFSRELIFHLAGRYHFSFSPLRYKIFFVSFFQLNKIRLFDLFVCLFFLISRASSFFVIHALVDINISSKKRLGFVIAFSLQEVRVEVRVVNCDILHRLTRRGWTDGRSRDNQNFSDL